MVVHLRNKNAVLNKEIIQKQFNYLVDFFDFEPGDVFIEILPLKEFDEFYSFKYGNPEPWIVGCALNDGVIIILDKQDFTKKQDHKEDEFERVILHELAHIFIRRILWPKQTYVWIEEGVCEFLSFKNYPLKNFKYVDFKKIKSPEGWGKYNPYVQSRIFFNYLSKQYGKKSIVAFIKRLKGKSEEESFKEVFGGELDKIEKDFKSSLKNETALSSRNTLCRNKI